MTNKADTLVKAIEGAGRGVFLGENLDYMRHYYAIARTNENLKIVQRSKHTQHLSLIHI